MRTVPTPDSPQKVTDVYSIIERVRSGHRVECTFGQLIQINNLISGDERIGDRSERSFPLRSHSDPVFITSVGSRYAKWGWADEMRMGWADEMRMDQYRKDYINNAIRTRT